ncbi:MAG: hypothetical protein ACFB22_02325 [Rhodothalassiaceae bacterium]
MPLRSLAYSIALFVVIGFAPDTARASIIDGQTVVDVTFDLDDAGLTPTLLGDAETTSDGFLLFPITGGDLSAGLIEHDGSGLSLSAGSAFVDLENFLIDISDPTMGTLFADITNTSTGLQLDGAPIFDLTLAGVSDPFDLDNPSIPLAFTGDASTVLNGVFGLGGDDALTEAAFGLAATEPISVHGPMAAGLLASGLALFAGLRRKTGRAAHA